MFYQWIMLNKRAKTIELQLVIECSIVVVVTRLQSVCIVYVWDSKTLITLFGCICR